MLERIAGKQVRLALLEQIRQRQIDRPHGAMEVDRPEQLGLDAHESDQGVDAAIVNRQPHAR